MEETCVFTILPSNKIAINILQTSMINGVLFGFNVLLSSNLIG